MRNKVIVVNKTHLDLGFTDFAKSVQDRYINEFIPSAINIARITNVECKKFVWTTGSWIIDKALQGSNKENVNSLERAMLDGDVAVHALPFTMHSELLDLDTLQYGIDICKKLDARFGKNTTACKMTDVPGHTRGLVPLLARNGIKLLHIGVNAASCVPNVPEIFLWKQDDSEVVVIYDKDYGGEHTNQYIGDVLCIKHTHDNMGAGSASSVERHFNSMIKKYPNYDVIAGTLSDYADLIFLQKDELPIVTSEIGDTWIHGGASDPYKVAGMRELIHLKDQWLDDGTLERNSSEYEDICQALLCIGEHTWGMDVKGNFGNFDCYLNSEFDIAKLRDKTKIFKPTRWLSSPVQLVAFAGMGAYTKGSFSRIEGSWGEQREYISDLLGSLIPSHRQELNDKLSVLIPEKESDILDRILAVGEELLYQDFSISIGKKGNFDLSHKGVVLFNGGDRSILDYTVYSANQIKTFNKQYNRDMYKNSIWALPDFGRPNFDKVPVRYPVGEFEYNLDNASYNTDDDGIKIRMSFNIDSYISGEAGAPNKFIVEISINDNVSINTMWYDKRATRLMEKISIRLYPNIANKSLRYDKLSTIIDPLDVASHGNRNLSAINSCTFNVKGCTSRVKIIPIHSALIGLGKGKILEFDDKYEDYTKEGIAFILYNNVWGTNFRLWYDENAMFKFKISLI